MKKFIKETIAGYSSGSLEIQKKAKILTIINILIFFSMIGLLPVMIFFKHIPGFIIIFSTGLIQIISLRLIKNNKYRIASNILIIYIFFGNTGSVISNLYSTNSSYAELYVYGFIMIFLIIEACLISYSRWQILMITGLCIGGVVFIYFSRILPNDNYQMLDINIKALGTVIFMLSTAGFIGWLLIGITKELILMAEQGAVLNKKRYERLETIMTSSKEGMRIGKDLITYSRNTTQIMQEVENFLHSVRDEVKNLHSVIDISQEMNTDVVQSTEKVIEIIGQQNNNISESSASINEIAASINNISGIMTIKKEAINQLLNSTNITENEIKQSIDLIGKISKSSDNINEIIGSIINVSDQINLLSMNAAIEAAYAGDYGKGFDVVAGEINRLAEDTGANTKMIISTLNTNITDIKLAERIHENTSMYFQKLVLEIKDLIKAIEETSNGLLELSKGSNEIINAVENLVTFSSEINHSMSAVAGKTNNSINNINALDNLYETIQHKIEEVYNYFNKINKEILSINKIGEKNIIYIQYMESEIRKIKEETE